MKRMNPDNCTTISKCDEHKVLYIATVVRRHIAAFHLPYLKMIKELGWKTAVAARNDYSNPDDCNIPYCDEFYDIPFERSPFATGNIHAYRKLKSIIEDGNFDIIHVHTPVGAMLGRLASRKSRRCNTKVVYTAHGFHFYSGAPILNWLLYYPAERFLARFTDVLITINHEDFERAKHFKANKVVYVPGVGIDLSHYSETPRSNNKRRELGLSDDAFVLISVGELSKNKNHSVVIEALSILKAQGCLGNLHYLICGDGPLEGTLVQLVNKLGLEKNISFLGFRHDVGEFLGEADLFAFPSIREGLPLALMEAMASGLPIVCTKNRGTTELVRDGVSAVFADDALSFAESIQRIRLNKSLASDLASHARKDIEAFDLSKCVKQVKEIYLRLVSEIPTS